MESHEDLEQLKQKLAEMESTVERLNHRLERNQREHEAEMKSTEQLLQTLKQSGTTAQTLYQRTQLEIENAKKDCKKNEDKAKQKKVELAELIKQLEELEKK